MKDNKLIAEFMDYDISTIASNGIQVVEFENNDVKVENLKYNTSWNWLMPVVGKCLEKHNNLIDGRSIIDTPYTQIIEGLKVVSRKETYQAVVEFIKQYNK